MEIYLLHKVYHEQRGEITWYVVTPYCEYETALKVVMSDTGKSKFEVESAFSVGDCEFDMGDFTYRLEETEVL